MKRGNLLMTAGFLLAVGALCLGSWIERDREFSPNENRYLSQLPQLSLERVLDGSFQEEFEQYLNDQIFRRDQWITVKTAVQKVCKDTDIGGAYVGKDGYDFEKITPDDVDAKLLSRNIEAVRKFFSYAQEQGIPGERLEFLLVPTSGAVMEDKLPAHARMFDQAACINQVQESMKDFHFLDAREVLAQERRKSDKQLYYRTDHHWTGNGAFAVYERWTEETGRSVPEQGDYRCDTVSTEFRGSLYSKILDYDSAYDSICTYRRKEEPAYEVHIDGKKLAGMYDESKLSEKDKYAYFFGGNYGQVQIVNPDQNTGNLLVIKDSFANSFVPLIAEHFHNIFMIDLRYYRGDVKKIITDQEITEILVLYNISNFISDRDVFLLGR